MYVPSELRVRAEVVPSLAHVSKELLHLLPYQPGRDFLDGRTDNLVASADGEGHAMADEAARGKERDICRRVITVGVHRVGSVSSQGGRETDI